VLGQIVQQPVKSRPKNRGFYPSLLRAERQSLQQKDILLEVFAYFQKVFQPFLGNEHNAIPYL